MTRVSFAETTGSDSPPEKALAPKEETQVAPYQSGGDAEGEFGREDQTTPRLNIVGKTGDLSNSFDPGHFVISKTHDLGKGPLNVVAVFLKKYYQEVVDFDDKDARPRSFNTAAEVQAAGLRVGKPSSREVGEEAAPQATILLWIEKPEGVSPEVADAFDVVLPSGRVGALALYTASKTSYMPVAGQIVTALNQSKHVKEKGLQSQQWKLSTELNSWQGKHWYPGALTPAGKMSDEDAEYLRGFRA